MSSFYVIPCSMIIRWPHSLHGSKLPAIEAILKFFEMDPWPVEIREAAQAIYKRCVSFDDLLASFPRGMPAMFKQLFVTRGHYNSLGDFLSPTSFFLENHDACTSYIMHDSCITWRQVKEHDPYVIQLRKYMDWAHQMLGVDTTGGHCAIVVAPKRGLFDPHYGGMFEALLNSA